MGSGAQIIITYIFRGEYRVVVGFCGNAYLYSIKYKIGRLALRSLSVRVTYVYQIDIGAQDPVIISNLHYQEAWH